MHRIVLCQVKWIPPLDNISTIIHIGSVNYNCNSWNDDSVSMVFDFKICSLCMGN